MDKYIVPVQSDLYYLTMFGCRLFCVGNLFGISEAEIIERRHELIENGSIDTQYEILSIDRLIESFVPESHNKYRAYFITIGENEIINSNYINIPLVDEERGKVKGIFKKYISTYNGEFKYHWVLQFPDKREDYNTVTTCTALKYGHIDTKSVMVIYEK